LAEYSTTGAVDAESSLAFVSVSSNPVSSESNEAGCTGKLIGAEFERVYLLSQCHLVQRCVET